MIELVADQRVPLLQPDGARRVGVGDAPGSRAGHVFKNIRTIRIDCDDPVVERVRNQRNPAIQTPGGGRAIKHRTVGDRVDLCNDNVVVVHLDDAIVALIGDRRIPIAASLGATGIGELVAGRAADAGGAVLPFDLLLAVKLDNTLVALIGDEVAVTREKARGDRARSIHCRPNPSRPPGRTPRQCGLSC